MLETRELFDSMSVKGRLSSADLAAAVDALLECEEAVTACAGAMLSEPDAAELSEAVRRDMDCADVVEATRRVLTRGTGADSGLLMAQLEACAQACEQSHELCSKHAAHHDHCRICSAATRACADMCRRVLKTLG